MEFGWKVLFFHAFRVRIFLRDGIVNYSAFRRMESSHVYLSQVPYGLL